MSDYVWSNYIELDINPQQHSQIHSNAVSALNQLWENEEQKSIFIAAYELRKDAKPTPEDIEAALPNLVLSHLKSLAESFEQEYDADEIPEETMRSWSNHFRQSLLSDIEDYSPKLRIRLTPGDEDFDEGIIGYSQYEEAQNTIYVIKKDVKTLDDWKSVIGHESMHAADPMISISCIYNPEAILSSPLAQIAFEMPAVVHENTLSETARTHYQQTPFSELISEALGSTFSNSAYPHSDAITEAREQVIERTNCKPLTTPGTKP